VKRPEKGQRLIEPQDRPLRAHVHAIDRGLTVAMQGATQVKVEDIPEELREAWAHERTGMAQRFVDLARDFERWKARLAV